LRFAKSSRSKVLRTKRAYGVNIPHRIPPHSFTPREHNSKGTMDYRVYVDENKKQISAWHDIPLLAGKSEHDEMIFNFLCEIPRGTNDKMELTEKERWNPIKQDVKKGELRKVKYMPYPWNYGAFPQTFSDPTSPDPATNINGDGDPIDVIDVGKFTHKIGEVVLVKVVGALALIDEGETDWKIIAINVLDPKAHLVFEPADLEYHKAGAIASIKDFFINYKVPDGKPKNTLAFNGQIKDSKFAIEVVQRHHDGWKALFTTKSQLAQEKGYFLEKTRQ